MTKNLCVLIGVLVALSSADLAAQTSVALPKRVVVYQDNVAWVTEEAMGGAPATQLTTRIQTAPLFGRLWAWAGEKAQIVGIDLPGAAQPGSTLVEMLQWADSPTLFVSAKGKTLRGRAVGVVKLGGKGDEYLVLETADGQTAVPVGHIDSLDLDGKPLGAELLRGIGSHRVDIRFSKAVSPTVTIGYFTGGLGWSPEYRVVVPEKPEKGDKAEVEVQAWALLSSSSMGLKSVKATLVAGRAPVASESAAFKEAAYLAPGWSWGGIVGGANGEGDSSIGTSGSSLVSGSGSSWSSYGSKQQVVATTGPYSPLGNEGSEPPVRHEVELTVGAGGRSLVPLGTSKAKGRFIYYAQAGGGHAGLGDNRFYESVVFQSPFEFPLLAGPAVAVRGNQGLGHGLVGLTTPRGEAALRMGEVPFLSLELRETSVTEDGDSFTGPDGYSYKRYRVKGTVWVSSRHDGSVAALVDLPFAGEAASASGDGVGQVVEARKGEVNPSSRVRWEVEVEAGERVALEYEFTTNLRSSGGKGR